MDTAPGPQPPTTEIKAPNNYKHEDVIPETKEQAREMREQGKGDLGARWLDQYSGPWREITNEDNNLVRNKIDRYLLPM